MRGLKFWETMRKLTLCAGFVAAWLILVLLTRENGMLDTGFKIFSALLSLLYIVWFTLGNTGQHKRRNKNLNA